MSFWRKNPPQGGSGQLKPRLRRRFAKLLMALGFIYIGVAIAAISQNTTTTVPNQELTTTPSASSETVSTQLPANQAVLGQTTQAQTPASYKPSQVFIPQCTYQTIPYKTVYKTASWLTAGQVLTSGGIEGEQKICSNQFGPPTITTVISPFDKTITTGTYQPTYYSGYTNVNGDYVPSPNYTGGEVGGYSPTAICADGTYSYSQNSSGTCSSHGGVSTWL